MASPFAQAFSTWVVPFLGGDLVFSIVLALVYYHEYGFPFTDPELLLLVGFMGTLVILGLLLTAIPYVGYPFYLLYLFFFVLPLSGTWGVPATNLLSGPSDVTLLAVIVGLSAGAVISYWVTDDAWMQHWQIQHSTKL
jgi:hypothetical protein